MSNARPLFSVITPIYNTPIPILTETIESVVNQTFVDWELILVDDLSPNPEVLPALMAAAANDTRIRVLRRTSNGGISAASNDAIAAAKGEFIALLDHDDLLASHALSTMALALEKNPEADYLYSDEDKVDGSNRHWDLFQKPDWSPERLRHQMYTCHLSVIRAHLVRSVGGFDPSYDGSQDHDLVLKVTEQARQIVHIPEVLYHWRAIPGSTASAGEEKPYAWEAGRRAVQAHLDRIGMSAVAEFGPIIGHYALKRSLPAETRVSVIIPTRGSCGMVWGEKRCFVTNAIASARSKTNHPNIEFVVVYDSDMAPKVLRELQGIVPQSELVLVPFDGSFNFSEKCNLGVLCSSGDVIVLLNDDIEAIEPGWLEALTSPCLEDDVGMTGARLLFGDGTIQHGGHAYAQGHYLHAFYGADSDSPGPFGALIVNRECSGVTAACAALRRSVFDQVGGLCERLPGSFNDVDFSLKIRAAGYRILWIANAELFHFESKTRDPRVHPWEAELVVARWGAPDSTCDIYLPDC